MATRFSLLPLFFFFINLTSYHVLADLILEHGYTVTTIIDGHKREINPHSVLSRSQPADLIILDSSNSIFYTVPFPISQESVIKRLSGDGVAGSSDGEPGSARFNKPRSFAVDSKGNIYVADRLNAVNGVIRKITNSGVSTIAGGYSKGGAGRQDGPAQNATFSNNFDVAFVAQECALFISDHGSQLVRRISLKPQDCASPAPPHSALGAVPFWVLGLALLLSCSVGIAIGFVVRPHIMPHDGSSPLHCSKTWRLYPINLVKQVLMICFDVRSAVARSRLNVLLSRILWLSSSHLTLMFRSFRINTVASQTSSKGKDSQNSGNRFASLLDSDVNNFEMETSQLCAGLKDLISFNGPTQFSNSKNEISKTGEKDQLGSDVSLDANRNIDTIIQANIMAFAKVEETTWRDGSSVESLGLVKRR